MSDIAIKVEDLGKLYRLGEVGTGTISHDLNRWVAKLRGKEDPFSKIGEINDRTAKGDSDYVWALKDVNFEVKKGEVLGIIGRNGAGKSTLLKLLSKVTQPSTGRIKVNGRIASLLEVGTGFHPEMTGRENIFLNGAIMGMTKREIKAKFDEIVDFAGVERYIDTPVKRYSSGMYVRLAFAVAAHMDPEILIVDEVLAVGDIEFQNKCLGKMKETSATTGRTVLFVSHNLTALKAICQKGLLLSHGQMGGYGNINDMLNAYSLSTQKLDTLLEGIKYFTNELEVHDIQINGALNDYLLVTDRKLSIQIDFTLKVKSIFELEVHVKYAESIITSFGNFVKNELTEFKPGRYKLNYELEFPEMRGGVYSLELVFSRYYTWMATLTDAVQVELQPEGLNPLLNNPDFRWGRVVMPGKLKLLNN